MVRLSVIITHHVTKILELFFALQLTLFLFRTLTNISIHKPSHHNFPINIFVWFLMRFFNFFVLFFCFYVTGN